MWPMMPHILYAQCYVKCSETGNQKIKHVIMLELHLYLFLTQLNIQNILMSTGTGNCAKFFQHSAFCAHINVYCMYCYELFMGQT